MVKSKQEREITRNLVAVLGTEPFSGFMLGLAMATQHPEWVNGYFALISDKVLLQHAKDVCDVILEGVQIRIEDA